MRDRRSILVIVVLAVATTGLRAAEPFRFPEGKHGKGELKYLNDVPVLTVRGTPQEVGEQIGVLAVKPVPGYAETIKEAGKGFGLDKLWPAVVLASKGLYLRFPEEHRQEIDAMARASGTDRDTLIVLNGMLDLLKIGGCSGLLVEADKSKTGSPLYGRNTDGPAVGLLPELSLVIVYQCEGKQPFATITYPGLLIGTTGINAAGMCFGVNDVRSSADKARRFDAEGVPTLPRLRKLIESCGSTAEGEKQVRAEKATTMGNILLCDAKGSIVLEVTPKSVVARKPDDGLCVCTNHFRSKDLATDLECRRFDALEKSRKMDKLGVEEVAKLLDTANQGDGTFQTVVYEPEKMRMHVAFGKHSSAKPLKAIDLAPLLKGDPKK